MSMHQHLDPPPLATQGNEPQANYNPPPDHSSFWRSKAGLVALGFGLVGAFLLLSEHWAHALGYLPFLLLFACVFLHMFMHGGHGGKNGHTGHGGGKPSVTPGPPSERV